MRLYTTELLSASPLYYINYISSLRTCMAHRPWADERRDALPGTIETE